MAGYLKIPRDLFNSDEWKERRVFGKIEAQVDLLQMAAYVNGRVVHCATRDVVLQRGQLLTTMRFLADRWGWSAATVYRYLQSLRNSNRNNIRIQIETAVETGRTLITICDYGKWDLDGVANETTDATPFETACETPDETLSEIKYSNTGEIQDRESTISQLVSDFKIACARADTREDARRIHRELWRAGCWDKSSEVWKSLGKEYQFLVMVWMYYPDLQMKIDAPLITWQSRDLVGHYKPGDLMRTVEAMANKKGIEKTVASVHRTLRIWLRQDWEINGRKDKRE